MTGVRRLLIDDSPGERRGVVLLDGAPEHLLIERAGESEPLLPGAKAVARIRRIERGLGLAFADLGEAEGVLPAVKGVTEGQLLEVAVAAPARRGKLARLTVTGAAAGAPRLLAPPGPLEQRLRSLAPEAPIETGAAAQDAADLAEDLVLATEFALGGGASLSIEETRGLVALDVDIGAGGSADRRAGAARINRQAVGQGARLLRLKGLAGLIVFDLVGAGQDGAAILEAARSAFAPDMPGVAFGPVSRLGVLHLAKPWRATPVAQRLRDETGALSPRTVAQRMARAIEREARAATRIRAACAPEVAEAAAVIRPALLARLGPRFDIQADPALSRESFETRPL